MKTTQGTQVLPEVLVIKFRSVSLKHQTPKHCTVVSNVQDYISGRTLPQWPLLYVRDSRNKKYSVRDDIVLWQKLSRIDFPPRRPYVVVGLFSFGWSPFLLHRCTQRSSQCEWIISLVSGKGHTWLMWPFRHTIAMIFCEWFYLRKK